MIGSSPRGRGKRRESRECEAAERLIPAWAGKTDALGRPRAPVEAHPRVGGENDAFDAASPAPAWLIPAWAGKTTPTGPTVAARGAHPRVGGENHLQARLIEPEYGSSPRGRGKPETRRTGATSIRLIPAWAGKTGAGTPAAS